MKQPRASSMAWLQFSRLSLRHARKAPWSTLALLSIVALGVAVFFSIRLANRAAVQGFQLFSTSLSGEAEARISAPGGSLPMDQLPELRSHFGSLPVTLLPVLEATASLPGTGQDGDGFDAEQVAVIGLDLLALRNLIYVREQAQYEAEASEEWARVDFGSQTQIHLTKALADQLLVDTGDSFPVILGDTLHRLQVQTVLHPTEFQVGASEKLILMDLPGLQSVLGLEDRVDRVEVILPEGKQRAALRKRLSAALQSLPTDRWAVDSSGNATSSAESMTEAFRLNLTLLSVLSLVVGLYLILQALEAAVVRRRSEIGVLLALGFERSWIRRAWLVESLVLGLLGSSLGLALGWLLAQAAVQAVAQTVNALYVSTTAEAAAWHSGDAALAFAIGVCAALLSGWLPARDASRSAPVQVMRQETRGGGIQLLDQARFGWLCLALGALFYPLPALELGETLRFPVFGYLAALCWMIAAAILCGHLFAPMARALHSLSDRSPAWRLTLSQLRAPTGRHKLTVAGLVVAVGMAASMDILIHSFEGSVTKWIQHSLRADLFIAVQGIENASNRNRISEETWRHMAADPQVSHLVVGHIHEQAFQQQSTFVVGLRGTGGDVMANFLWMNEPPSGFSLGDRTADGAIQVLISESFGNRFQLQVGDEFNLPSPSGVLPLHIVGRFADYGNERGSVVMDGEELSRLWKDSRGLNVAVTLKEGADLGLVRGRWMQEYPGLAIRSNRMLREEVLRIFRETFSVTHALKAIGILVAVAGLALALFSLLIDRRQQLQTLRELGFTRKGIRHAVSSEGLLITMLGLLGGLLLSLGMGSILIFVINRQSFGWTLSYRLPWWSMALLAGGVLLAGWVTSIGVAQWGQRLKGEISE